MRIILLAAGAAAVAVSAGASLAQTAAGPKQPVPYSQLNAYLKATPKQRATKDWSAGAMASSGGAISTASADTGTTANTSAATSATPSLPADTGGPATSAAPPSLGGQTTGLSAAGATASPSLPTNPPIDTPATGAVNPSPTATPGAPSSTTPPK